MLKLVTKTFIIFLIILLTQCADYNLSLNETQPATYTFDDVFIESTNSTIDRYFERCYGIYGCFPVDYPWRSEQRAHSVYPFSPTTINPRFPLFTNQTRTSPTLIDITNPSTIPSTALNPSHKFYFIIHGFLELGNAQWMVKIMNEILDYDPTVTVVLVDWRGGSTPPYYQAAANTRVVGAVLAHIVMAIVLELDVKNLDNFHLIGHSLGAHISGYAGYYLQRDFGMKLGRITGLDPAKPYFEFTPPIVRLDPSDAQFVNVLHTDSATFHEKSLGMKQRAGHVDFYPNGGRNQPFCNDKALSDPTCNHKNAVELFIESINTKCPFTAISCENYEQFLANHCTTCSKSKNLCTKFGFHAQKTVVEPNNQSFYFLTSPTPPFCKASYKISIKISDLGDTGRMDVRLYSTDNRKSEIISLTKSDLNFEPGQVYSFFVTSKDIGRKLERITVLYSYKLQWMVLKNPEISFDFIEIESIDYGEVIRVCSKDRKPLINGFVSELREVFC